MLTDNPSPTMNPDYQSFIDGGLIEWIVSKKENYKYRYHWHYYWAVHKEYSQMEGVYVSKDRKAKCEAMKKLVDAATITLTDPIFNTYYGGYYWGIRLSFEYKGSQYNWYDSLESGGCVDKIYKVENDVGINV